MSLLRPGPPAKRVRLWLLLLALVLAAQVITAADDAAPTVQSVSIDQYITELESWASAVDQLESNPDRAAKLQNELPDRWTVDIPGAPVEISTGWIGRSLESIRAAEGDAAERRRERLAGRIAALQEEARRLRGTPISTSLPEAESRLQEILARPEFRDASEPGWFDRLRAQLTQSLLEFLVNLLTRAPGLGGLGEYIIWVLVVISLLIVAVVAWRILARATPRQMFNAPAPAVAGKNAGDWLREAREAAQKGQYRVAIHNAYWAAVYRASELGHWKLNETRTHREYLRHLSAESPAHAPLSDLTRRFEQTWYAGKPAGESDYTEAIAIVEDLRASSTGRG